LSGLSITRKRLLVGTVHISACILVTHSPTAAVSYSVRRILSRSFNNTIILQIVICYSHFRQKSVLLITDQSRSRHQHISLSPSAQGSSPRSFSLQVSPDPGIQRISSSPQRKGAHRDPSLNAYCHGAARQKLAISS
jgi:hypothetical protein